MKNRIKLLIGLLAISMISAYGAVIKPVPVPLMKFVNVDPAHLMLKGCYYPDKPASDDIHYFPIKTATEARPVKWGLACDVYFTHKQSSGLDLQIFPLHKDTLSLTRLSELSCYPGEKNCQGIDGKGFVVNKIGSKNIYLPAYIYQSGPHTSTIQLGKMPL